MADPVDNPYASGELEILVNRCTCPPISSARTFHRFPEASAVVASSGARSGAPGSAVV